MTFKFYEILEIPKNCSQEDIKKSYKKLAIKHHPDKGGDEETFKKINEAYATLSDQQKREKYDMVGDEGWNNGEQVGGGVNVNDIFSHFFGGNPFMKMNTNMKKKMNDVIYEIEISLRECYFGIEKTLKINIENSCKNCVIKCGNCNGTGQVSRIINQGFFQLSTCSPCDQCRGSGFKYDENKKGTGCNCLSGVIHKEEIIHLKIPKGVHSGETYKYPGFGGQSTNPNDIPGDLVILVKVKEEGLFKRMGNNLLYKTSISFEESIVGKTITVEHFDKNLSIDISMFGIIKNNMKYFIKGFGINGADLIVEFEIKYPEGALSPEIREEFRNVFRKMAV